jgi:hypothetical protein
MFNVNIPDSYGLLILLQQMKKPARLDAGRASPC